MCLPTPSHFLDQMNLILKRTRCSQTGAPEAPADRRVLETSPTPFVPPGLSRRSDIPEKQDSRLAPLGLQRKARAETERWRDSITSSAPRPASSAQARRGGRAQPLAPRPLATGRGAGGNRGRSRGCRCEGGAAPGAPGPPQPPRGNLRRRSARGAGPRRPDGPLRGEGPGPAQPGGGPAPAPAHAGALRAPLPPPRARGARRGRSDPREGRGQRPARAHAPWSPSATCRAT